MFWLGVYCCKACKEPLFTSDQKFDSGCGYVNSQHHQNLRTSSDLL